MDLNAITVNRILIVLNKKYNQMLKEEIHYFCFKLALKQTYLQFRMSTSQFV